MAIVVCCVDVNVVKSVVFDGLGCKGGDASMKGETKYGISNLPEGLNFDLS